MKIGRLRHLVDIEKQTETRSATGDVIVTWTAVASDVWAGIEPLRGREYFAAKQFNSEIEARIILRYRDDVTAKMRIVHGSDEYYIDSIINLNARDRELHLMCTRSID